MIAIFVILCYLVCQIVLCYVVLNDSVPHNIMLQCVTRYYTIQPYTILTYLILYDLILLYHVKSYLILPYITVTHLGKRTNDFNALFLHAMTSPPIIRFKHSSSNMERHGKGNKEEI